MLTKCKMEELDPTYTEMLADLAFEIGKDQASKKPEVALQWLEKSCDLIAYHDLGTLSPDASELKMSISYNIIKVLLKLGDTTGRVRNLFLDLKLEHGDRFFVLLLELDLLAADFDTLSYIEEYGDILQKIIRSAYLTDSNLKTIIHHVHKLRAKGPQAAYVALRVLISERLLGSASSQWIEKAVVTAVWIATSSQGLQDPFTALHELLNLVTGQSSSSLSPDATHASQMVGNSMKLEDR